MNKKQRSKNTRTLIDFLVEHKDEIDKLYDEYQLVIRKAESKERRERSVKKPAV